MFEDYITVYKIEASDFPLKPTGILDGRGRPIYSKPVVGFTRKLREYVVDQCEVTNRIDGT